VGSLAALQELQSLSFAVNDDAEVAAVSALQHVTLLYLAAPVSSSCAVQGLAALAAMRQLQELTLDLLNARKRSLQDADVVVLLSAVQHVPSVLIRVREKYAKRLQAAVRRVERGLIKQGLQLAAKVEVMAIKGV
jgi:hypothetical protein